MKVTQTLVTLAIVVCSIGILFYQAGRSVSSRTVLPLGEYIASSTNALTNSISSSTDAFQINTGTSTASTTSVFHAPFADFRILVARTSSERQQGLSGRVFMDPDEGLLFVFPVPGDYGFWMKDMHFPIDIVWIDADRRVVGISENLAPETYPQNFYPPRKVQFVLEVNAGAAKKAGLKEGSVVGF